MDTLRADITALVRREVGRNRQEISGELVQTLRRVIEQTADEAERSKALLRLESLEDSLPAERNGHTTVRMIGS